MKQLLLILSVILVLSSLPSCKTYRAIRRFPDLSKMDTLVPKVDTVPVAIALGYVSAFEKDPKFRAYFGRGMNIPNSVFEYLNPYKESATNFSILYGKKPEVPTPVFVCFYSKNLGGKNSRFLYAENAVVVSYPCPTHCGTP